MKIIYDPQIFSAQKYGGVSRYYCEIASRIARIPGFDVSIAAPMHVNEYLRHVPRGIVSGFRAPDIDMLHTGYPRLMLRVLSFLLGDIMLRTARPDIVHETYFSPYRLGGRRARRVLTIYDMIHEKFTSSFPHADKTAGYKKIAAERADHVICISESTRRDVIDILGLAPEKTSVVYLGFDLMNTQGADVEQLTLPAAPPFLLYVGNRGGYKNFLLLLEAFGASHLLKSEYKLICFGGGEFNQQELTMMRKLGLDNDQVIQLSGNDKMLAGYYEHACAFIYPSQYEGFGIPPLEAMAHDCPVICSNTSSIPEVVGDAGEYFDPIDPQSLIAAVERVIPSVSRREVLVKNGRERLKYFSWERCAAETINIYKQLL